MSFREHHLEQGTIEVRLEKHRAAIEGFAKGRMRAIERGAHPRVLGALAGEEEGQRLRLSARHGASRGGVGKDRAQLVRSGRGAREPDGKLASTEIARVAHVGEVGLGHGPASLAKPLEIGVERRVALGREREEVCGPLGDGGERLYGARRLLENDEGIGAADTERVDTGAPRMASRRPAPEHVVHIERAAREADGRVGVGEVESGRKLSVINGKRGLDQAGQPGRLLGMTDIALDRAHRAVSRPLRATVECARQRLDLEGIAGGGARGVALHVADGLGRDVGEGDGLHHCAGLAGDAGRGVADLAASVVVDRASLDDGVDVISVREGVSQPLEENGRDSAPEDGALPGRVEGTAVPIERVHVAFLREVADHLRNAHGGGAAERHVALARHQALAGEVYGHQRRRAGRLDGEAGSGQIELVGDARAEEILVVAEMRQARRLARQVRMGGVGEEIAGDHAAAAREHAHHARDGLRVVAGIVEGLPGHLEEEALLGIHQLRLARRIAEEGRVEMVDVGQHRRRPHVARPLEQGSVHPRLPQLRL